MKRLTCLLLAFVMILCLTACGLLPKQTPPSVSVEDPTEPTPSRNYETEEITEEDSTEKTEETTDPLDALFVPGNSYVQVYRTQSGAIWAIVAMEFTNVSDTPLFFNYGDIDLLGHDGEIFQTIETVAFMPQIIEPGETGYYCEVVALDVSEEIPLTPKLSENFSEVYPVNDTPIFYEVSDTRLSDSLYGGLELKATVKNTTSTDEYLVCVAAILKDKNGEFLGFISGYLDSTLPAGEAARVTFESFMLPETLSAADVAELEVYAYPFRDQP